MSSPYVQNVGSSTNDKYKIAGAVAVVIVIGLLVYYFTSSSETKTSSFMPVGIKPVRERPYSSESFLPENAVKRGLQWKSQGVATSALLDFDKMDKFEDNRRSPASTYAPETPEKDLEHLIRQ